MILSFNLKKTFLIIIINLIIIIIGVTYRIIDFELTSRRMIVTQISMLVGVIIFAICYSKIQKIIHQENQEKE
jgi:hypothetical protein